MCRILFVKPPIDMFTSGIAPPLGILYVAAYLKSRVEYELEMKLLDLRLHDKPFDKLNSIIYKYKPEIVGITACSEDDKYLHKIASEVKNYNRSTMVVVGGPHSTMYYNEIMKNENVDICVIGEGEITFYNVVNKYISKEDFSDIKGIAYREASKVIFTGFPGYIENLDELPFPLWELLEIDKYSSPKIPNMNMILSGKKYMGIVTSRGCPYRCIYCHNIFGKKFRARSPENVLEEMGILITKYNIDEFQIYDDIFNLDGERLEKICNLIIASNLKIKLCFPNGLRGDILTPKQLLALKKAGAYMVTFAVETASERLQKMIKKFINIQKLRQNIIYANKIGLITKCYFMIGFPTETIDEIISTINFACLTPLDFASFFIVTPHKTTELYNLITQFYTNFDVDFNTAHYYISNKSYEKQLKIPLIKIQRFAYRKFYLNPRRLIRLFLKPFRKEFIFYNFFKFISLLFNKMIK